MGTIFTNISRLIKIQHFVVKITEDHLIGLRNRWMDRWVRESDFYIIHRCDIDKNS